jgi:hypothetical protein
VEFPLSLAFTVILQFRANHVLIGGLFGIAMIASFGTWMTDELVESFVVTEEDVEMLNISIRV